MSRSDYFKKLQHSTDEGVQMNEWSLHGNQRQNIRRSKVFP